MAKILFITSRFPYPLTKGDRLRVFFQLKHLAANNEIHLVAINDKQVPQQDLAAVSQFCESVQVHVLPLYKRVFQVLLSPFKRLPLQVAFFYNEAIRKKVEQAVATIEPDHIHCHLIRTMEYVRNISGVRKSLDFMDAFGKGMEKRAALERNFLKRAVFRYEQRLLHRYEKRVFSYADRTCIISKQDRDWIPSERAAEIIVLPNGVDFDAFYPRALEKKYDVVFMGNLDYPPNIVAVNFLLKEIVPLVIKSRPALRVLIAGAGASQKMRALGSANVDFVAHFEHISDSIAISGIMIAPMIVHIGMPNKVIQAMAMKVPCIVSSLSNNAIGAENNRSIVEANTANEFAAAIIDLLNNEEKANYIAEEAFAFVRDNYSWEKQNEIFNERILKVPYVL